ncbi:winged helix-turn-helix transcriptional regulator [Candidatus Saccharibacteria bacterium]|nr:winged helix-turn-helix transcriptional regulator [Candidatus Saccharibacteria bacterium]
MPKRQSAVYVQLPGAERDPRPLDQIFESQITTPDGDNVPTIAFTYGSLIRATGPNPTDDTVVHLPLVETHAHGHETHSFNGGKLLVDSASRKVFFHDVTLTLPKKVFNLLAYLAENCNRVLLRRQLLDHVWGDNYIIDNGDSKTLDVHIRNLRKALCGNSVSEDEVMQLIRTVRGVGYMMVATRD